MYVLKKKLEGHCEVSQSEQVITTSSPSLKPPLTSPHIRQARHPHRRNFSGRCPGTVEAEEEEDCDSDIDSSDDEK